MKLICTEIVVALLLLVGVVSICIRDYDRIANSPFDADIQKKTFEQVAKHLNIKINPAILPPRVLKGNEVTNEYNNSVWGFDVGDKRSNIFDYHTNTIILTEDSIIHNLAHEYTHYFQYYYLNADFTNDVMDSLEREAIRIQNSFRK